MANLNFHRLMKKMKIGFYCYFIADIVTKGFYKCLLSGCLPNIYFLFKPLNLIRCHDNRLVVMATKSLIQFAKNIKKVNSLEAICGIKMKCS